MDLVGLFSFSGPKKEMQCFQATKKSKMNTFLCPATKKVAGYYVIPSEILSVRPSVSVSAPTILLPATPPTVLGQSFSNFTGAFRMV